jgi:tetratricopeptide (TPR) repeat protein
MAQRALDQATRLSEQGQNWLAAVRAWQLAADRFSLLNDRAGEATALHNLAQAERELDKTEAARRHLEQAAKLNERRGRTNEWWRNQIALLQLESHLDNGEQLKKRLDDLLARSARLHDPVIKGLFLNELGLWQKTQRNFMLAEKAFAEGEQNFKTARDSFGLAVVSANRAELYEAQANYPAAISAWKAALRGFESLHDPPGIARALAGQGAALLAANTDLPTAEDLLRHAARNYRVLQKPKHAKAVLELLVRCLSAEGKEKEAEGVRADIPAEP